MRNMHRKRRTLVAFWVIICVILIGFSLTYTDRTEALVALVESEKMAVSYDKPVVIERIFVKAGQQIAANDVLVEVSRADLQLDLDRLVQEKLELELEMIRYETEIRSKNSVLKLELERRMYDLEQEKLALESEKIQAAMIASTLAIENRSDSTYNIRLKSISDLIAILRGNYQAEVTGLSRLLETILAQLKTKMETNAIEMAALVKEKQSFIYKAKNAGSVGSINVETDELVPSFMTILSILEEHPTVIKAFMNERVKNNIKPGDSVTVVSENRLYKLGGKVEEIGSRIVSYPAQLQPLSRNLVYYGQEVFIRIPRENTFLNGEKVFVHYQSKR
jgi:multidrug resistance efflux pump